MRATDDRRGGVVVYLNSRYAGDVQVLNLIATEYVISAQLRSEEYVRRTDPHFPRGRRGGIP